jgi:hypothetical protein
MTLFCWQKLNFNSKIKADLVQNRHKNDQKNQKWVQNGAFYVFSGQFKAFILFNEDIEMV